MVPSSWSIYTRCFLAAGLDAACSRAYLSLRAASAASSSRWPPRTSSTGSFGDSAIQRAAIADAEARRLSRLHGVEAVEEHKLVSLYDGNRTQPRSGRAALGARG